MIQTCVLVILSKMWLQLAMDYEFSEIHIQTKYSTLMTTELWRND